MSGDTVLKPIEIEGGINRNITSYQAVGKWIDCDKVRFTQGQAEKLGGWAKLPSSKQYRGIAREALAWAALNGDRFYSIGTDQGLFLYSGNDWYDITPLRATATETSAFSTQVSNPYRVKVSDAAHGAIVGDYIAVTSVSDVGSGLDLNGAQEIVSVATNTYVVSINSFCSSNNGPALTKRAGAITIGYLLQPGLATNTPATGYGAGTYGSGVYGTGTTGSLTNNMRLWCFDTWGEDLMALYRGGPVYRWDKSDGLAARASLADTNTSTGIPTASNIILITEEARHMMLLGTSAFGGDFDPLAIRWSQSENYLVWSPAVTNAAGGLRLNSGSYIVGAIKSKKEIVALTDEGVHSIVYSGAPFFFGQQRVGINCGLTGPNALIDVNGTVYWMSKTGFYKYDGTVTNIECPLQKQIFEQDAAYPINFDQKEKIFCGANTLFDEIWWFYPSNADENNRYVIYNISDNVWYDGNLDRTTWIDSNLFDNPFATSTSAAAYAHEDTHDANGQEMTSFIESGYFDIEDGQPLTFMDRIIPDTDRLMGEYMTVYVKLKKFPHSTATTKGPYRVGPNTKKISLRGRARQMSVRIEVSNAGSDFRLGRWRMGIAPDGER